MHLLAIVEKKVIKVILDLLSFGLLVYLAGRVNAGLK
jgi:hypothetical protein